MKLLDKIVKQMLETHKGGEVFFDHLDEAVRSTEPIIDALIALVPDFENQNIIVSGKFGTFFSNLLTARHSNAFIIAVNGSLRKGHKIMDLSYLENQIHLKDFIFIDDSFYSGSTRNVIEKELNRLGAELTETYVVYDGSYIKEDNVKSLYRYY